MPASRDAHGRYIYFMDSDDLLEKDAMDLCYRKCEEEQLDFVFFDAQKLSLTRIRRECSCTEL